MRNIFLLVLLVLPAVLFTLNGGNSLVAYAQDEDEELVDVEMEETSMTDEGTEESEDPSAPKASPDADTTIMFVKPVATPGMSLDLPAGKLVEFLVGFSNKGSQEMVLETLDASFRYPMDFTFYIQNFSALGYYRTVKPTHQATLLYSFIPSDAFAGRPFGLSVNLRYKDASGAVFHEAVYNETINVVEIEEGLDGETFFLYVFLAACVVLLLVAGQHFLYSVGRGSRSSRSGGRKHPAVETGTNNSNDVDYDWLPRETLNSLNKSPRQPKMSPRSQHKQQSPRSRKSNKSD